jgi:dTDP-4-amino-4,6-dideoxygalactose transaminase
MFPALTSRIFLGAAAAASAVSGRAASKVDGKPALLGGAPVRSEPFPSWPMIADNDERSWMDVLRSKNWYRRSGHYVEDFEKAWAGRLGAKHCLATANGTSALFIAMNALEVGPKDEVIVPPYTFIATVNAVLLQHAMPVFVDSDRSTLQIDAHKIEAAITPRTRCIMPVHLGGAAADMDTIMAVARKHNIPVVEDACQSHLAEWRGKTVSSSGDLGCFSFQASKNLNSGEGGALITNTDVLLARADAFHNIGRGRG